MTRYSRYIKGLSVSADVILLNICFIVAYYYKHQNFVAPFPALLLYANIAWFLMVAIIKPYKISRTSSYGRVVQSALSIVIAHLLLVFAYYVFQQPYRYSREFLLLFYGSFATLTIFFHLTFFYFLKRARAKGYNYRNIILIAHDEENELANHITNRPQYGYHVKVSIDARKLTVDELLTTLNQHKDEFDIHEIFYSLSTNRQDILDAVMYFSDTNLSKVRLIADFNGIGSQSMEIESFGTTPVIKLLPTPLDQWHKQVIKRSFDIIFSILIIVLILSWLIPLLAIIIKCTSKGPVFFKQQRTGRDNQPFWCYKLRSMYVNNDSDVLQAKSNDARITKIGWVLRKTSIDELPQFYNVLIGNMSVVGPRPHMLKHTEDFTSEIKHFMQRHHIKPGITGLAQSKGFRGETADYFSLSGRVKYDLYYVRNWSFWLDMQIIYETIKTIFTNKQP